MAKRNSGTHDLLIDHDDRAEQRLDVPEFVREHGNCRNCRPPIYKAGTPSDFVDTSTTMVVWRGWAEGAVDGVFDDHAWMQQGTDFAVVRILVKLPCR